MLIACDVDNVVAALYAEWFHRYNVDFNDDLSVSRVTSWDLAAFVKPECGVRIFEYLKDPDLYSCVQPIEGALDGVNRIRVLGHDILFATSCHYGGMVDRKASWLERHGFCLAPSGRRKFETGLLPDDLFVGNAKRHIGADLIIEDAGHTVREWVMSDSRMGMRRAILFEYPHNADLDLPSLHWHRVKRAPDWATIVQHIESQS